MGADGPLVLLVLARKPVRGQYRYPLLRSATAAKAGSARLATLEDIAGMKLAAVAQRGSRKDFVDVYALGRRLSLSRMLGFYRRKYRIRDIGHVLFALTYFDDAEHEPMPRMLKPWSWATMKESIQRWVREAAG